MSSSSHTDNKKKDNLILGKDTTQGLEQALAATKENTLLKKTQSFVRACITMEEIFI